MSINTGRHASNEELFDYFTANETNLALFYLRSGPI
jgi:hypothetical protein